MFSKNFCTLKIAQNGTITCITKFGKTFSLDSFRQGSQDSERAHDCGTRAYFGLLFAFCAPWLMNVSFDRGRAAGRHRERGGGRRGRGGVRGARLPRAARAPHGHAAARRRARAPRVLVLRAQRLGRARALAAARQQG